MVDDIPGRRRILKTNRVIAVVGLSASWCGVNTRVISAKRPQWLSY
ncbi:MAG TPA: hypothetical protein VFA36_01900 [Burkholderiales bacterium]|nr:hypothetical protein [Burkholderiales bacterium]